MKIYKTEIRDINDLVPYAMNARTHSDEQVDQIAASIREFGFTNNILIDENGTIIAGHGRVLALKKLGETEVPCTIIAGLTEAQRKALVLADNKLALNAGWDEELLKIELQSLQEMDFDIDLLGFSDEELELINAGDNLNIEDFFDETGGSSKENKNKEIECPHCGEKFEP